MTAGATELDAGLPTAHANQAPSHRARWVSWFLGAALLAAVIVAATHFSEERAFVRLAQQAEPWWLAVAVLLQVGTYAAQGGFSACVALGIGSSLQASTSE